MSGHSRGTRVWHALGVAGTIIDAVGNAVPAFVLTCLAVVFGYLVTLVLAAMGGMALAVAAASVVAIVLLTITNGGGIPRAAVRRGGPGLLNLAAGLLPGTAGPRYREEWLGELYDLRADGAPWRSRAHYVLGVLCAAPRLAISMRLHPTRAVD